MTTDYLKERELDELVTNLPKEFVEEYKIKEILSTDIGTMHEEVIAVSEKYYETHGPDYGVLGDDEMIAELNLIAHYLISKSSELSPESFIEAVAPIIMQYKITGDEISASLLMILSDVAQQATMSTLNTLKMGDTSYKAVRPYIKTMHTANAHGLLSTKYLLSHTSQLERKVIMDTIVTPIKAMSGVDLSTVYDLDIEGDRTPIQLDKEIVTKVLTQSEGVVDHPATQMLLDALPASDFSSDLLLETYGETVVDPEISVDDTYNNALFLSLRLLMSVCRDRLMESNTLTTKEAMAFIEHRRLPAKETVSMVVFMLANYRDTETSVVELVLDAWCSLTETRAINDENIWIDDGYIESCEESLFELVRWIKDIYVSVAASRIDLSEVPPEGISLLLGQGGLTHMPDMRELYTILDAIDDLEPSGIRSIREACLVLEKAKDEINDYREKYGSEDT